MKRNSFLRRLLISFLIIAVIPLFIVAGIYFYNTIRTANASAEQRLDSAADQAQTQLDSLLDTMSYISSSLVSNDNFIGAAAQLHNTDSGVNQRDFYSRIYSELCSYAWFSYTHNVTFFNDDGFVVTSYNYNMDYNHTYRLPQQERNAISWYDQVQDNYGQAVVVPVQESQIPQTERKCMSVVRAVRNPGKTIGYLSVDIEEEDLSRLLEMEGTMNADLLILREDGALLYKSADFPVVPENGLVTPAQLENLNDGYFTACRNTKLDTKVYLTLSRNIVYKEVYSSLIMLGLQVLCLLCLTCLVVMIFIKDLSRPLVALRREMEETTLSNLHAQGNEKLFNRFEEIAYLYRQFHKMRERLDVMVQREMEHQTLYLEERMNYLQTQINPHFMCNTLNVIGIMGSENGAPQVQEACLQLSSLLQYSIADKSDNLATLEEEMQNILDYLHLMQLRYEHKLAYQVEYDPALKDLRMPRLVMEPFVENIFSHAYGPNHRIVHVRVSGVIRDGRWYVTIEDDGQGISSHQLQQMRAHIHESCRQILAGKRRNREYGIGVENTIMRLYLYYGDTFRYELESEENAGFRIRLSADIKKENKYETDESADSRR